MIFVKRVRRTIYPSTSSHRIFLQSREAADDPVWNLSSYLLLNAHYPDDFLIDGLNEIAQKNDALRLRPVFQTDRVGFTVDDFVPRQFKKYAFESKEAFLLWAEKQINTSVFHEPGMWTAFIIEIAGKSGILNIGHHAMSDGLNVVVLYKQLLRYIAGEPVKERSYLPHLEELQAYLRSGRTQRDQRFWKEQLRPDFLPHFFPSEIIAKDLSCINRSFSFERDLVLKMAAFCETYGVTEAALLYAATALAVFHLSKAERFSLGIPVLGRATQDEMQLLGLFMHIVPLLIDIKESSFLSFLQYVQEQVIGLFKHQKFTAYDIREQIDSIPFSGPLYDISVDYSVYEPIDACEFHALYNDRISVPMELHFLKQTDHRLGYTMRYRKAICESPIAARFPLFLNAALNAIIAAPEKSLIHTSLLTKQEQETVLLHFNDTAVSYDKERSVYDLFEAQVKKGGQACIRDERQTCTFAQLNDDASRIDAYIRQTVGAEKQVVGVLCDRSYAQLAAIFGIVRGGNVYLPISPRYPSERMQTMLQTSGCKLVLAQKQYAQMLECACCVENILAQAVPDTLPAPAAKPDDALYVIYTSGSTGTPKGAMVTNRSAVNRIQWMANRLFDEATVVMLKTPYTFDVSVWEIFGFAMCGFSLYILPPDAHYSQNEVLAHIERGQVTDLHFVPTVFEQFLSALDHTPDAKQKLRSVRHLILSGESLLAKDVNAFRKYHDGQITVHNLYGPAECAVDVTAYTCAETETDPIPIGKPIANTQIYILDNYMQPVPIGVTGELCIAGDNVGLGYLNRPELTTEKFVDNPFGEGKLYKTGDLAHWRADGNIVFVGRNDFQVKLNGQRVEPGEIETALSAIEGVDSAAVIVKKDETDRPLLCAFYTGKEIPTADLRALLSRTLPRYMVPQVFVHLETMPLTASGKTDRSALPAANITPQADAAPCAPAKTKEEIALCKVLQTVLHSESFSMNSNYFALGGDSIRAIHLVSELEKSGYKLSVADVMRAETLRETARQMKQTTVGALYRQDAVSGPIPFSPIQQAYMLSGAKDCASFMQSCIVATPRSKEIVLHALDALVQHHDMLRAVFDGDSLRIRDAQEAVLYTFAEKTQYRADEDIRPALEALADCSPHFDLDNGPLVDIAFCETKHMGLLKISVHHFAVDLLSWEILLDDFYTALTQAQANTPILLPPKTAPFAQWLSALAEYRDGYIFGKEIDDWKDTERKLDRLQPFLSDKQPVSDDESFSFSLTEKQTALFLHEANRAFQTQPDELLLAALALAAQFVRGAAVGIHAESFGRVELHRPINVSRTVGWFTACFPIIAEVPAKKTDLVIRIKDRMRRIEKGGLGYLLLYQRLHPNADILFNFFNVDSVKQPHNRQLLSFSGERAQFPNVLNVNGFVFNNVLQVTISVGSCWHKKGIAKELGEAFQKETLSLLSQLAGSDTVKKTLSDYSDQHLTESELKDMEELFE